MDKDNIIQILLYVVFFMAGIGMIYGFHLVVKAAALAAGMDNNMILP